ncbi:MAG: hypothetical protein ABL986_03245 [Vicinamibacterales bacterium]
MANETQNHPVAEGAGAAGGTVAGMAIGAAVGGPIGAVVGAAIGAVAGGAAGHGIAVAFDPKVEDAYWRDNYRSQPYVKPTYGYDEYREAYLYGGQARARAAGTFDETSDDLERGWDTSKRDSRLAWDEAKDAIRDGWHHVERAVPGDADGDGR